MRTGKLILFVLALLMAHPGDADARRRPIRPRGDVDVQIIVDGRAVPDGGQTRESRRIHVRQGDPYSIRVTNHSDRWVEVVAAVDGLDVIDGQRADYCEKRGYVLAPGSSYDIEGWRTSMSSVDRFRFVHAAGSEAAQKGTAYSHLGWIQVACFYGTMSGGGPLIPEHTAGAVRKKDLERGMVDEDLGGFAEEAPAAVKSGRAYHQRPRPDPRLGTGRGGSSYAPAEETTFWRDHKTRPDRMINIKYSR